MPNRDLILKSLDGTPVTIFFEDHDGRYRWFVNPQSVWLEADRIGASEADLFSDKDLARLQKLKDEVKSFGEPRSIEVTANIRGDEKRTSWSLRLTMNKATDQQSGAEGFIVSSIDISDQKQREQTLKNLLREVAHRSKNMLSIVLSLSSQTSRVTSSKQEFLSRFTGRVQSLAKSQDVITDRDWRGSTLSELVERQVTAVIPIKDAEVSFSGDDIELGPNGTLHVGLALHELVTNALIHGALTGRNGRIAIRCEQANGSQEGAVLTWTETPRIKSDNQKTTSFGRTMLERIVPSAVNGHGSLELQNNAVRYTLKIGKSEIV